MITISYNDVYLPLCVENYYFYTESILAKRRGYGTIISYNVPPYGRAGLYLELANLKDLIEEFRSSNSESVELSQTIFGLAQRSGMVNDVPLLLDPLDESSMVTDPELPESIVKDGIFKAWVLELSDYLNVLQDRLFSSGLR